MLDNTGSDAPAYCRFNGYGLTECSRRGGYRVNVAEGTTGQAIAAKLIVLRMTNNFAIKGTIHKMIENRTKRVGQNKYIYTKTCRQKNYFY